METLIRAGGVYFLAFGVFHLFFWRLFDWKEELRSLSFLNRGIVQVLNLCLSFAFFVFAYISLAHASELLASPLGAGLLVAMALLWLARAVLQIVFFGLRHRASMAFLVLFLAGAALYAIPAIYAAR